ncbi:glycosyltransferase [Luteolibacter ambystomatis]|uniref:Glycosyltransferase n=1 Tax=Luteolibacter ambystomatis TaxID=2824561 RepID=A0A975G8V8_9BACT|nr:glycosyltransferase [Luteolibacter ambystomatis]QUE50962.1 glycosyltransferase [Luteolibacter ambystomatis]
MIRVCHVLASVGEKGGLEKNVIELANRQAAIGHEVSVVADETMRPHFSPQVTFVPHRMDRGRINPFNLLELRNNILSRKPQIVHAHANKAGALVKAIRRFLPGIKRVATVQNTKSTNRPFRGYDAIITASAQVKESLKGLPATVIWNSIAPPPAGTREAAMATKPPFPANGQPVFCTVGRLVPAKGMDLLLEAMARVPGFYLWMVGEGLQRPELETLLERHALHDRVWMAGHRDDAVGLMGCADLFVVASRNEGGPYTLAEALHMKVPCISTRVGFAAEFLPDEALMQPYSVDELERGLKHALADLPGLKARLQPSFDLVATEVTLEAMTGKVIRAYERVLGE